MKNSCSPRVFLPILLLLVSFALLSFLIERGVTGLINYVTARRKRQGLEDTSLLHL